MDTRQPSTPLFAQHSRSWQENRYVYPVISRRSKGLSIGINLNTDRICNFDCVYCCVDRNGGAAAPQQVNLNILQAELDSMLALVASGQLWELAPFDTTPEPLRRLNDVAFSGDGEPTSSRAFGAASQMVERLLHQHGLMAKIVVITNATLLDRPSVRHTLGFLDSHHGEIWAKLDAGNDALYQRMVRTSIPFARVLESIRLAGQERQIVIQSMFLSFDNQPPTEQDIADYLGRLSELVAGGCQIRLVQIYTIARPVFEQGISPLPKDILDSVAARVRQLGLNAEAYYAATDH
jgi:wyosine [tRNA(Phe)-imidazoG37] synthetase (radical SAM superfamily)